VFYHADGSGNVTALVNGQEGVVARYGYDPFGNVLAQSGSLAEANLYRFSSKELHVPSGLVYYGRRFFDSSLQRWLNPDPLGEAGGINLYVFVGNSPVNVVDPRGEDNWSGVAAGGALQNLVDRIEVPASLAPASLRNVLPEPIPYSVAEAFADLGTGAAKFLLVDPKGTVEAVDAQTAVAADPGVPTELRAAAMAGAVSAAIFGVLEVVPGGKLLSKPCKKAGLTAAKTGGQPLFRAVTDAELQSIQNLNRFSTVPGSSTPIPGVQGKWFYSNLEDAQRWAGQAAARDGGPLHIIRTSVPESVSPAWSQPWVDGIQNPALFHRLENLNGPITVIPPPIP